MTLPLLQAFSKFLALFQMKAELLKEDGSDLGPA